MKLEKLIDAVNVCLADILTEIAPSSSKKLTEAMEYSLLEGGKRLRPVMLLASYLDVGKKKLLNEEAKYLAFAIETLHCYTLIHDDLPCMDDDIMRRGKPTTHIKFGETTAVLAGDALLNASFQAFIKAVKLKPGLIHAGDYFYALTGASGLISGQSMEFELDYFDENTLIKIFTHKTAALFKSAAYIGGVLGLIESDSFVSTNPILADLENFALNYGLAFQLKDDLDDLNPKGYAARFGVEKAKKMFYELKRKSIQAIEKYDFPLLAALAEKL